ncbi:hypothetical protein ACOMHN_021237 [Nucella lapillus]
MTSCGPILPHGSPPHHMTRTLSTTPADHGHTGQLARTRERVTSQFYPRGEERPRNPIIMVAAEQPSSVSFSFAGCGFLRVYHLGVVECLQRCIPRVLAEARFAGASAGALICNVCHLQGTPR